MTPASYMKKAERALISARLLLENDDMEGACNRAYYAMFDAAHAALGQHGQEDNPAHTRTHAGLIAVFGQRLVKPGLLGAELGRSLNQVEQLRLLADYTGDLIDPEKACWVVEQAERFVAAVRQWMDMSDE